MATEAAVATVAIRKFISMKMQISAITNPAMTAVRLICAARVATVTKDIAREIPRVSTAAVVAISKSISIKIHLLQITAPTKMAVQFICIAMAARAARAATLAPQVVTAVTVVTKFCIRNQLVTLLILQTMFLASMVAQLRWLVEVAPVAPVSMARKVQTTMVATVAMAQRPVIKNLLLMDPLQPLNAMKQVVAVVQSQCSTTVEQVEQVEQVVLVTMVQRVHQSVLVAMITIS